MLKGEKISDFVSNDTKKSNPDIELLRQEITDLEDEINYVDDFSEVIEIRRFIEQKHRKIRELRQMGEKSDKDKMKLKNGKNDIETVKDPFRNIEFSTLPERIQLKLKKFVNILKEVDEPEWNLRYISMNTEQGVSVYGYYWNEDACVKVRLSDHLGRWSGYDIDLRNPKDSSGISNYLKSRKVS